MSRPDTSTPEGRAALQAELRGVAVAWRVGGVAVVLVAVLCMVIASGLGRSPTDPVLLASLGLLAAGWLLVAVGIVKQRLHRRHRLRDEPRS